MRWTMARPRPAPRPPERSARQKRSEELVAIRRRDARTLVADRKRRRPRLDGDLDRRAVARVMQGVLDQIAQRLMQRIVIAVDGTGASAPITAMSRSRRQRHGRQRLGHLERERREIGLLLRLQGQGLQLGHLQQLVDQSAHARHILAQRRGDRRVAQRVEMGGQDRKRRAQLMRRVGREVPLGAEALIETVERRIDRLHQRRQLAAAGRRAAIASRSPPA